MWDGLFFVLLLQHPKNVCFFLLKLIYRLLPVWEWSRAMWRTWLCGETTLALSSQMLHMGQFASTEAVFPSTMLSKTTTGSRQSLWRPFRNEVPPSSRLESLAAPCLLLRLLVIICTIGGTELLLVGGIIVAEVLELSKNYLSTQWAENSQSERGL